MPTAEIDGISYAYVDEGDGPLIVFGHGLLASREMFRAQIDALSDRYRCVSVDWPGHGESGWRDSKWTFWELGEHAATLVREHLGAEQAVFVGLSQGGFAFMRLAVTHPEMVRGLVLLDTTSEPENPEVVDGYRQLAEMLRGGDEETRAQAAGAAAMVLYGPTWREAEPEKLQHEIEIGLAHPREGLHIACQSVFDRADDMTERLGEITAPTLVICGEEDAATPPHQSQALAQAITGAELVMIPAAGHHTAIENPPPVTAAIERFLETLD